MMRRILLLSGRARRARDVALDDILEAVQAAGGFVVDFEHESDLLTSIRVEIDSAKLASLKLSLARTCLALDGASRHRIDDLASLPALPGEEERVSLRIGYEHDEHVSPAGPRVA